MMKSGAIIAIVVLLSCSQLHYANAAIKSLKQSYSYPDKQVKFNWYAFKDGSLVYAVCDGTETEKTCTVVQRQFPYEKVSRTCNVTLQLQNPKNVGFHEETIVVQAFGQKNAILFWGEEGPHPIFNSMAIQLDSCKTQMLQLDDPLHYQFCRQYYQHRLVTYDDEFDIFFRDVNSSDEPDKTKVGMRISFDREPQPIFDIILDNKEELVLFISPIETRSPDKGYVYSTFDSLYLVKPDGAKKLLASGQMRHAYTSAVYGLITMCVEIGPKTTCTQYDENGDVKFNVTIEHEEKKGIRRHIMHNSPHGGFLLMISSFESPAEAESFTGQATSYDVVRVDSEGSKVGSIRLTGFVEEHEIAMVKSIWENGDEYCATLIGQSPRYSVGADNLSIVVNCFTENDFQL